MPDTDLSEPAPDADTLTKAQLAELLYQQIGFNKRESKDLVDAFFDQISERLIQGDDVKLSGFGNFQVRTKAPRPGRNPRTGEAVAIAARRVVTFHASPKLKEAVQSGRVSDDDGSDA
nr:integration host factor subunit alpha [Serpentinimonas barnesii]